MAASVMLFANISRKIYDAWNQIHLLLNEAVKVVLSVNLWLCMAIFIAVCVYPAFFFFYSF